MHNTAIWLHNVTKEQPKVNLKTTAAPLASANGDIYTECRLTITNAPGYSDLTLLMTNAQARQIINTLQTHLDANDKLTVNWAAFDNQNANPS
jgi:hypothetical protein